MRCLAGAKQVQQLGSCTWQAPSAQLNLVALLSFCRNPLQLVHSVCLLDPVTMMTCYPQVLCFCKDLPLYPWLPLSELCYCYQSQR